jgi:toluene monooxygenase electron transfer component
MSATHRIRIEGGEQSYDCGADDTLLRAGLRAGLGLAYECNVGSCSSCKFQLVEGDLDVRWREAPGLSARDWERGRRLACQSSPKSDCRINIVVAPEFVPKSIPQRFATEFVEAIELTHDMREFRFRVRGRATFLPGQYALLRIPGVTGLRAYSMSNLANAEGLWEFAIRRVPNGAATSFLFERLEPGSTIDLDGPYGLAYLRTDSTRDLVCIAGGSGLSPMISIARGLVREPSLSGRRLHFFYGARGPLDVCGETHLCELPGFGERILFHPIISMPQLDERGAWKGERGFVHELVSKVLGNSLALHEFYMAGPPPMVQAAMKMLMVDHKVPVQQIHYDRFF